MPALPVPKEQALAVITRQLQMIEDLKKLPRNSPEFVKWHRDTLVALQHCFPPGSRHAEDFKIITYEFGRHYSQKPPAEYQTRFVQGLDRAAETLRSISQELAEFWIDSSTAPDPTIRNAEYALTRTFDRFHAVVKQLRQRHQGRPTLDVEDEYDVQDLLHALLRLDFEDVRPEEWTPSYAGSSARTDFLLKDHRTFIEVKKTRKGLDNRKVAQELIVDSRYYQRHPDCDRLFCFVYDPDGRIANPRGLEKDLSGSHDGIAIIVVVRPSQ